jgi:uncharacterized protein involved in exopolysaccharide biosynthesis
MNEQQDKQLQVDRNDQDISFKEIILKIKSWFGYIKAQWWKILIVAIIGGALGLTYRYFQPNTYTAKLSFVVEEGKSSSGGLASLAGQFGIDVGSIGGSNTGLLSGENLLLFLKSTSLARETLLSAYDSASNYSLADKYADQYKLRSKWANDEKVGTKVYFPVRTQQPYTRLQDSLVHVIINKILKKELSVVRPEKKATFISVEAKMRDELLSKFFCERIVQKATERYVQSKTKRQQINVDRLQRRADSIGAVLNNKTYYSAAEQEKVLDVNPGSRTATVTAEVSIRDKLMLTTIYGEVVKNLEIAKVQLSQETPTIQIVDNPELPIRDEKSGKLFSIIIFAFVFVIFSVVFYTLKFSKY